MSVNGLGESRTELLNWLNDLLQLNYKKIEECGTGAAYCQIMDSIYGDIPMHRVKFNGTAEYEYQTNYKVLQSCFARHNIEKTVYVEKLIRCRFQDNLEFLQWIKRFWLQNKDESKYDPLSRRKYRPPATSSTGATSGITKRKTSLLGQNTISNRRSITGGGGNSNANGHRRPTNDQLVALQAELSQTHSEITTLKTDIHNYQNAIDVTEKERNFYFGKLRAIEILVQSTQDLIKEGVYNNIGNKDEFNKFLEKVQQILYATEEGFEQAHGDLADEEGLTTNNISTNNNNDDIQIAAERKNLIAEESNAVNDNLHLKYAGKDIPAQNIIIDEETF